MGSLRRAHPEEMRWVALPLRVRVGAGFPVHAYLKLSRGVDLFAAVSSWR
jgi:hypothetical protein